MPTNKPATVYLPTSVDERPEKDGWYAAVHEDGHMSQRLFEKRKWRGTTPPVFWLKKVTGYFHTKEELVKLLSDVWDAAYDFRLSKSKEVRSIVGKNSKHFPDKETFIQSIIKP